jgi:hypothetical protein
LAVGILFLRLHTLPERMAHRTQKLQFEIVAVLGLLSLFTHMHIFWVAGLLLAVIDLPDFGTPLRRMAGSLEKLAGLRTGETAADSPSSAGANVADVSDGQVVSGSRLPPNPEGPAIAPPSTNELSHV